MTSWLLIETQNTPTQKNQHGEFDRKSQRDVIQCHVCLWYVMLYDSAEEEKSNLCRKIREILFVWNKRIRTEYLNQRWNIRPRSCVLSRWFHAFNTGSVVTFPLRAVKHRSRYIDRALSTLSARAFYYVCVCVCGRKRVSHIRTYEWRYDQTLGLFHSAISIRT